MTRHEFFLILGMALVTFAVRYPVLALVSRMPLPDGLLRAMRFIPPAVLTAIVVPAVLIPDGQTINFRYDNSYLIASLLAGVVAWQSKNLLLTIIVGMLAFGGWRWALGAF